MESPIVTAAEKGNVKLQYYDWQVGDRKGRQWGICVPDGDPFPNMGFAALVCPHPTEFSGHYFSEGSLGHGNFCTLCGEFLQAG
ncbi:hypothetical protein LCGC14_1157690 [marine sediment metagenome]|uniref:Uncharacterized protein n=1 Tax=marine sediment metagenome TaxID=412755 RepID=A0A0F9LYL9_9ZZZZ